MIDANGYRLAIGREPGGDALRNWWEQAREPTLLRFAVALLVAAGAACEDVPSANVDAGPDALSINMDAPAVDASAGDAEVDGGGGALVLATSGYTPTAIAVAGGFVYWADYGVFDANANELNAAIRRVPTDGGTVETIVDSLRRPIAIAISQGYAYWIRECETILGCTDGAVNRVPIAGGTLEPLATNQPGPARIAVDSANVYWTNTGNMSTTGTVMKRALSGGSPMVVANGMIPAAIVVDANNLYWSDVGDYSVRMVPLGGGTPTVLAAQQPYALSIAVNSNDIFIVNAGAQGFVAEAPFNGSGATTIVPMQHCFGLAVDEQNVYFGRSSSPSGAIFRVPVTGGTPMMIAPSSGGAGPIAMDDVAIYWIDGRGLIMKLAK